MKKSQEWTEDELDMALRDLKNNKSRDFDGFANELFKNGVIGSDLKKSLLILFNNVKKENKIPQFMNFANVTTVPKPGSRLEPANERGIFRVEIVRSILMRMIYNSKYFDSEKERGAEQTFGLSMELYLKQLKSIIRSQLHCSFMIISKCSIQLT